MYTGSFLNKLYSYFLNNLGMQDYTRGWLKGDCPFCGAELKFGIHLSNRRANCFVCGNKHNPRWVIMQLENLKSYQEFSQFIGLFTEIEYTPPKVEKRKEVYAELPEGFTLITLGTSQVARSARGYLRKRGFNISKLALSGVGYCGIGEYSGYIIIPYYFDSKLIYFNARRFLGSGPRYKNPTEEAIGIGKSLVIYNAEALYTYKKVYLTEGAFNALTMGDRGISTGGKKLSDWQLSFIIKSPVEELVLLGDPDALKTTIQLALDLAPYKRIRLPILPGDSDVNDLGKKQVLKIIKQYSCMSWSDIIRFKNSNYGLIREKERQHIYAN